MTAISARGRGRVDHILRTAARGAALIGVAVVIGIVLLQVVDKGSGGGGGASPPATSSGSTSSTTKGGNTKDPSQVRVLVLNGSGTAMAAATKANALRGLGYAIAGTGNAPVQTGTTVACNTGFEKEAQELVKAVGSATVAAFPNPPPTGAENADCIVTLGK